MAFNLQSFVDNPSLEVIEKCRKDELLMIANHFQITISKQSLKRKIKAELIDRLSEFGFLSLPDVDRRVVPMDEEQDVVETGIREGELAATEAEAKVGATLSPFEPFSLGTPKSTGEAK